MWIYHWSHTYVFEVCIIFFLQNAMNFLRTWEHSWNTLRLLKFDLSFFSRKVLWTFKTSWELSEVSKYVLERMEFFEKCVKAKDMAGSATIYHPSGVLIDKDKGTWVGRERMYLVCTITLLIETLCYKKNQKLFKLWIFYNEFLSFPMNWTWIVPFWYSW